MTNKNLVMIAVGVFLLYFIIKKCSKEAIMFDHTDRFGPDYSGGLLESVNNQYAAYGQTDQWATDSIWPTKHRERASTKDMFYRNQPAHIFMQEGATSQPDNGNYVNVPPSLVSE